MFPDKLMIFCFLTFTTTPNTAICFIYIQRKQFMSEKSNTRATQAFSHIYLFHRDINHRLTPSHVSIRLFSVVLGPTFITCKSEGFTIRALPHNAKRL